MGRSVLLGFAFPIELKLDMIAFVALILPDNQ